MKDHKFSILEDGQREKKNTKDNSMRERAVITWIVVQMNPSIFLKNSNTFTLKDKSLSISVMSGWMNFLKCIIILKSSEKNVKALSKLMISTGELLARQIDNAATQKVKNYEKNHLERIIHNGKAHIGRMLHYFPFS